MAATSIEVPDLDLGVTTLRAKIVGLTALLMHKPNMAAADGKAKSSQKVIPPPDEEAAAGAYRLPSGELFVPAIAVQRSMIAAAVQFQDPSYKKATLTKPVAAALIPPEQEGYVIVNGDGKSPAKYEVDVRRAVLGAGKTAVAVMRARPRIDTPWSINVEMGFDASMVAPELLVHVLAMAGKNVGLLDFRPQKGGPYGRFSVETFEVEA